MNIGNIFFLDYWFSRPEAASGLALWAFAVGFLLLILLGFAARVFLVFQKNAIQKKIFTRLGNFGMTMGFLGLMWLFFRQERASFLSWRLWLLFWLLLAVWWLISILKYILKRAPEIEKMRLEKENREKYLPKKK